MPNTGKHIVITGGCGFIGHHLVDAILQTTNWNISILDALSYASRGLDRLNDIRAFDGGRVQVFPANLAHPIHSDIKYELRDVNYIVHMGAEVHVDKSIADPEKFISSNVMGTFQMLQLAREVNPEHFLYFSTDEVFGPASSGTLHTDWSRYNSTNPYSATKAAGEELTLAWANTYGVPVTITHCTNVFGERQNPEAFIPATIGKILRGEQIKIHTNAAGQSGARYYIYAEDVANAVLFLLKEKANRDKFNISGTLEVSNLEVARLIALALERPLDYVSVHNDRPGCDFRYGLSDSTLRNMGWKPTHGFPHDMLKTVNWYKENPRWLTKRTAAVFK